MFKFAVIVVLVAAAQAGVIGVGPTILAKPTIPLITTFDKLAPLAPLAPLTTTKIIDTGVLGLKTIGPIVGPGVINKDLDGPIIRQTVLNKDLVGPNIKTTVLNKELVGPILVAPTIITDWNTPLIKKGLAPIALKEWL